MGFDRRKYGYHMTICDILTKSCIPWDAEISVHMVATGCYVYITPSRRCEGVLSLVAQRHRQALCLFLQTSLYVYKDYMLHKAWPDLKQPIYRIKKT